MNQKSPFTKLLQLGPASFNVVLLKIASDSHFQLSEAKDDAVVFLSVSLMTRYLHWRAENGVSIDFEHDIQFLLKNDSVRTQLSAALFEHGEPTIIQLETVLDLLILASYSRHITVNQTVKLRTEGAAPRPPGFSKA